MKLDEKRVIKKLMTKCVCCAIEYDESLDFVSCSKCQVDICKKCRQKNTEIPATCFYNDICEMKENVKMCCDYCDQVKNSKFWVCEKHDYTCCDECLTEKQVKCPFNHPLIFKPSNFKCFFCDDNSMPIMGCACFNAMICLKCIVERDYKMKDAKGHPYIPVE
jgi:hypothetical protein